MNALNGSTTFTEPTEPARSADELREAHAAQDQFAHLPPLPANWLRIKSEMGAIHYMNALNGSTALTEPTEPARSADELREAHAAQDQFAHLPPLPANWLR